VTIIAAPATWTAASANPQVINVTRASFAPGSGVTDAVLAECGLEWKIPEYIAAWSPVPVVLAHDPTGAARLLTLEVRHVLGPGGGRWTGPKSMSIYGELLEPTGEGEWQRVASFHARRTTTRGRGTCEMLEVVANAIGRDVRPWLARPSLNTPLGEL
jgi:hypothetical protein